MSYQPSFVSGDFKAVCQRCGRVFKGSQLRRTWDGLYVCSEDWEEKHPQLQVRGVRDDQRPPFTVPDPSAGEGPKPWEVSTNKSDVVTYNKELQIGSSSVRPLPTSVDPGTRYFDTNESNVLFSNGTHWLYANGQSIFVPTRTNITDRFIGTAGTPIASHLTDDGDTWFVSAVSTANTTLTGSNSATVGTSPAFIVTNIAPWTNIYCNVVNPATGVFYLYAEAQDSTNAAYVLRFTSAGGPATNVVQPSFIVNGGIYPYEPGVWYTYTNTQAQIHLQKYGSNVAFFSNGVLICDINVAANYTSRGNYYGIRRQAAVTAPVISNLFISAD